MKFHLQISASKTKEVKWLQLLVLPPKECWRLKAASVVDGEIVDGHLILTKYDGTTIDAGPVLVPGSSRSHWSCGWSFRVKLRLWPGSSTSINL